LEVNIEKIKNSDDMNRVEREKDVYINFETLAGRMKGKD